jgi:hypothetical protein
MATTNTFDFKAYNALMANANSGLKIVLAERLLLDVQSTFIRFENPLAPDMILAHKAVKLINEQSKELSAAFRLKQAQNADSAAIDNATVPPEGEMTKASNSADAGMVDATK